jgi:predicted nucleic-acid-binding protein
MTGLTAAQGREDCHGGRDGRFWLPRGTVTGAYAISASPPSAARKLLQQASLLAVPLPCLCELVWILRQGAKLPKDDEATAVRSLMNAGYVVLNRPAAELGLAVLEAGGDFADGVIAYEGAWLGGETLVSFDKKAVNVVSGQGEPARWLS